MIEDKLDALKKLEAVQSKMQKTYGKGSVIRLSGEIEPMPHISSGNIELDSILGINGYPRGRVIEIFGQPSSGKSLLTLHAIKSVQEQGGIAVLVDSEFAFNAEFAKTIGVKVEDLWLNQPSCGEEGLTAVQEFVESGVVDLIVVDSVASLTPRAEIDGDIGQAHIALLARLMSQSMRKLTAVIGQTKTTVIFINQIRENVNAMAFGKKTSQPGGRALPFYSSIRLEMYKKESLKKGDDVYGITAVVKTVKNKVAPPFKQCEITITFDKGMVEDYNIIDLAVKHNLIKKSGSWYSYGEEKLGQGKDSVIQFLESNPIIRNDFKDKLKEILAPKIKDSSDMEEQEKSKRRSKVKEEETIELDDTNEDTIIEE